MLLIIKTILAVCLCFIAAVFDWKSRKIPNTLTFGAMILGLLMSASLKEVLWKVIGLAFLFLLGYLRLMGLGDLKLWMALSTLIGFLPSTYCIGLGALLLIIHGFIEDPKSSMDIVRIMFTELYYTGKFTKLEQKKYAFAPYIFVGLLIYLTFVYGKAVIH